MALDNGPRPATALIARDLRAAMRVFAIATLMAALPLFAQGTSDPAVLAQQALAKCEQAFLACAKTCVGATCVACEQIRAKCKADVHSTITPKPPVPPGGTTGTPGKGVPPPPSPTPAPPPPPPPDCSKLGEGATCENDQCKECRKGKCVPIAAQPLAKSKITLGKKIKPIRSESQGAWAPTTNYWGYAWVERVNPTITARCDKGVWRVVVTGIKGDYSVLTRLLPGVTEVTGPKGNTTKGNYCNQVTDLNALSMQKGSWFMLRAIEKHEAVHVRWMQPSLAALATEIEALFAKLTVPITPGKTRAQAIAELQALPAYQAARQKAYERWRTTYLGMIGKDHGNLDAAGHHDGTGPAYVTAERGVVNPMIKSICDHARTAKWPSCPLCPKPLKTTKSGGGSW
jgi:hypothetical protein